MQFALICCTLVQLIIKIYASDPATENRIFSSNSIFSNRFPINLQSHQFGVDKPSKLRLYLLADLAKAAAQTRPYINCESSVELKIASRNCTCANFACQRYYKTVKKPRIFERNCEDVCCGKQRSKGKSLDDDHQDKKILPRSTPTETIATIDYASPVVNCGEIIPDNNDKLIVPWIVQISSEGQDRCIGSLLSSRAVITSLNCIDKTNDIFVTRFNSLSMQVEKLPVKEIIRDNLVKKSIILVLAEPVTSVEKKYNPCLPQDDRIINYPSCYLGLPNRGAAPVKLLPQSDCTKITAAPHMVTNNLCVQYDYPSEEHAGPGAPLFCSWHSSYPHNFQIVGVLSEKFNNVLVFDNIQRIQNMIKANINLLM